MLTRTQVKAPTGMKFYPDQRYLARPDTEGNYDIYPYTAALASRPDMEEFDPWARKPAGHPVDPTSLHHSETSRHDSMLSNLTNGVKRETVRAELAKCTNPQQRIFYSLSLLWKVAKANGILIESFEARHYDVSVIMGPAFTRDDLRMDLIKFKTNPDDLETLMKESADEFRGTDQPTS